MASHRSHSRRTAAADRIARIRERLRALDHVCSGTLLKRFKVCGKPECRCAEDPDARHGPYYEWGRMKGGRLVHRTLSPEQAVLLRAAIANYRVARRLLRAWEEATLRIIEAADERN
jgi:hypothetical protein